MKCIVLIATLSLLPLLSACNTMAGAGQDISDGGQKLEQKADENK